MLDLIKKTMLTGLGLAVVTKERIEELSAELVKKGELSEKQGREFVDEMMKKSEQAQADFERRLEESVRAVVEKLNLATKEDIESLHKRLDALAHKESF